MSAVATAPPREALDLRESITLDPAVVLTEALSSRWTAEPGSIFDAEGRVPLHIIRPTVGKGRGRHLYEASMLAENASKFSGWKMYLDHQSPAARKAADGLPRPVRDLGGRITEAFWDPDVPADPSRGFEQGAVVGLAKPVPAVRELIENDPEIIEASISASATNVHPAVRGGQKVWVVEGIAERGSVDWVTEAGAGGRVAPLLTEAYSNDEEVERVLLEAMTDDEVREYLSEHRPNLALQESPPAGPESPAEGGDDDMTITPEQLQEALSGNPELLVEAFRQSQTLRAFVDTLVEERVQEAVEGIREEASSASTRAMVVRDLRDEAHSLIRESRLPESWQTGLAQRFEIIEGRPTEALDLLDEVDDDGKVVKTARQRLREAVEHEIAQERTRLAEVAPTRVRQQGPSSSDADPENGDKPKGNSTYWGQVLQEAGIDPDTAYDD